MAFQAANPDALDDKATAAALKDYLARIAKAQVWSNTHRDEWAKVWSEETGLSVAVTRAAVDRRVAQPVPISAPRSSPPSRRWPTRSCQGRLLPGEVRRRRLLHRRLQRRPSRAT